MRRINGTLLLLEATRLFAAHDAETALSRLAENAVRGFTDWCVVQRTEDGVAPGSHRRLAVAHPDAHMKDMAAAMRALFPMPVGE